MPEFCTCGAQLPPDALFCHKCGKPQRELVVPETVAPPTVTLPVTVLPPPPAVAPLPLNFHNRAAVKIALLVAGLATLLSFLPYVNCFLGGFLAVLLYRRRTSQALNLEAGVRMGWITGLMIFGMTVLMLACLVVSVQAIGGVSVLQGQLQGRVDQKMIDSLAILQHPSELAMVLVPIFVFTMLLTMAGGALGVKLTGRPTSS